MRLLFRYFASTLSSCPLDIPRNSGRLRVPQVPNAPTISGRTIPGQISCQYGSTELRCDAESSEGHRSTASIAAKPPYVFIGELYDLDFVWFTTGVIRLASRNGAKDGVVNVYAMTDGAKVGDIGLKPDKPMKILYAGEEATGNGEDRSRSEV